MGVQSVWFVTVWTTPPGERYRDIHPDHRGTDRGCGIVESVGKVKETTYKTRAGADRGAQVARDRYEGAPIGWYVEIAAGGRVDL